MRQGTRGELVSTVGPDVRCPPLSFNQVITYKPPSKDKRHQGTGDLNSLLVLFGLVGVVFCFGVVGLFLPNPLFDKV